MNKLAIPLSLLLILPAPTFAQSSQDSGTPANNECPGLARACSAAAKELKAARDLIKGYEQQVAASDKRLDLAQKEVASLKQLNALESDRGKQLEAVIAAEREAKANLLALKAEQEARIAQLEKKLSNSRKIVLIAGMAAVVAILISIKR